MIDDNATLIFARPQSQGAAERNSPGSDGGAAPATAAALPVWLDHDGGSQSGLGAEHPVDAQKQAHAVESGEGRRPGQSVLVVDDEEAVATVLARCLTYAGFDVATASGGHEALERLKTERFDALLTDIHMPRLRGDEMQRMARQQDPELAVLLITAADETACAVDCLKDGVYDYLIKPFDLEDVIIRVRKALERRQLLLENRDYRANLERRVAEQSDALRRTMAGSLAALIYALEAKDPNTHNHSTRVSKLATELTLRLFPGDFARAERVRVAALLHDIGKIGVQEYILHKQGKLSDEEFKEVKKHPEIGQTILAPIMDRETVEIVRSHHEHFDGRGYPRGLAGDSIPLGGRIIAVADAFDAMTSERPYRRPLMREAVLAILRDGAGSQWDPVIVEALLAHEREGMLQTHIESDRGVAHEKIELPG